jgi:hypothetical protein
MQLARVECLYLCSEEPDISGMLPKMPARPTHPSSVRVKGGEKTFAADPPRIWGAGWRLAAILRKAREEAKQPEVKGDFGRRCRAPRTRAAYPARALAHVLDGPERLPQKTSSKMDSADPRCFRRS